MQYHIYHSILADLPIDEVDAELWASEIVRTLSARQGTVLEVAQEIHNLNATYFPESLQAFARRRIVHWASRQEKKTISPIFLATTLLGPQVNRTVPFYKKNAVDIRDALKFLAYSFTWSRLRAQIDAGLSLKMGLRKIFQQEGLSIRAVYWIEAVTERHLSIVDVNRACTRASEGARLAMKLIQLLLTHLDIITRAPLSFDAEAGKLAAEALGIKPVSRGFQNSVGLAPLFDMESQPPLQMEYLTSLAHERNRKFITIGEEAFGATFYAPEWLAVPCVLAHDRQRHVFEVHATFDDEQVDVSLDRLENGFSYLKAFGTSYGEDEQPVEVILGVKSHWLGKRTADYIFDAESLRLLHAKDNSPVLINELPVQLRPF